MLRSLFCIAVLGTASAAHAAPMVTPEQCLAATCFNCHGPHGVSRGAIPSLAGQPAAKLLDRLMAYKSGQLAGTVMPQIAKGYTDEQIKLVADYFAKQSH